MNKAGHKSRSIGRELGRDKSTICYELRKKKKGENYRPDKAHAQTLKKRGGKKQRILDNDKELRNEIVSELKKKISPDIICAKRRLQTKEKNISTETLYQYIYGSKYAQKQKLYLLLARKRKTRLHHGERRRQKRVSIPDRISITERETIVRREAKIGHLEGDLTFNKGNQSMNIGGLVDIRSQKIFLFKNNSKRTKEVVGNINKKLNGVKQNIKTITFDNGKEFTNHKEILPDSNVLTYFCNAYSPWQKPLIEKMNSMIHRLYNKGLCIKKLTRRKLQEIEDFLNDLPRKSLGYKTPNQIWDENVEMA